MILLREQYSSTRGKRTACGRTELHSTPQVHLRTLSMHMMHGVRAHSEGDACTETPGIGVVYTLTMVWHGAVLSVERLRAKKSGGRE